MIDERDLLEQALRSFEPEPGLTDRIYRRRDRKRRNQRIAAGVVGIAVFVAAVWVVTTAGSSDRTTTPADKPPVSPAEDVATDFVYAIASFNTDLAVYHLAGERAVSGLGLDGIREFRQWLSLNEAAGFEVLPTSCEETGKSSLGTHVRCTFDFHGIRSEAIGRAPYTGSYFDLLVTDPVLERGAILDVSQYLETGEFGPQMWIPFGEWVSTTYPADADVMYMDDNLAAFRLTARSIRLWEQRTREYVETGSAETGPAKTGPTVAPGNRSDDNSYRIPPEGAALSTPVEGELIAEANPLGSGYARVYADGRVLSSGGAHFVERRLSPEGVELVRSGAVQAVDFLGSRSLVPESAWEDREGRPYVPARYGACFWRVDSPPDFDALLDLLPASAQALLRGSDPAWNPRCLEVTPDEARSLEEILSEARPSAGDSPYEVGAWSLLNGDQFISLRPLFPDGQRCFQPPG